MMYLCKLKFVIFKLKIIIILKSSVEREGPDLPDSGAVGGKRGGLT